jgi:predicted RNA binding protein YcfA (HicA-like mRNA interferase family)
MTNLPSVTGKELITALSKVGFQVIRVKGSHHFLRHQDGRATVVEPRLSAPIFGIFAACCASAKWAFPKIKPVNNRTVLKT